MDCCRETKSHAAASFGCMKWGMLLLLIAASGRAQNPRFETHTNEVLIPVSVSTKSGKPVEDLTAQDFVVTDDGTPHKVRLFTSYDAAPLPIEAVIVLEADDQAALAKIKKTASLISSYITNDMGIATPSVAAVVTVANEIHLAQNFTADPDTLGDTFAKISGRWRRRHTPADRRRKSRLRFARGQKAERPPLNCADQRIP